MNKQEDRCKHGVMNIDCFECYPTNSKVERIKEEFKANTDTNTEKYFVRIEDDYPLSTGIAGKSVTNELIATLKNPYYDNADFDGEAAGFFDKLHELMDKCDFIIIQGSNGMFLRSKENFNGGRCDCCNRGPAVYEITSYEFYRMVVREDGKRLGFGECNNP